MKAKLGSPLGGEEQEGLLWWSDVSTSLLRYHHSNNSQGEQELANKRPDAEGKETIARHEFSHSLRQN